MFAVRRAVSALSAALPRAGAPARGVCTPARTKVNKMEELFLAATMVVGWTAIPIWVLVNIKHYKHGSH